MQYACAVMSTAREKQMIMAILKQESCGPNVMEEAHRRTGFVEFETPDSWGLVWKERPHTPSIKSVARASYLLFVIKHWMQQRPNPDRPGLRILELFSTAICLNLSDILAPSSCLQSTSSFNVCLALAESCAVVSERRSLSGRASLGGFVEGRGALSLASLSTTGPFNAQLIHFYPEISDGRRKLVA